MKLEDAVVSNALAFSRMVPNLLREHQGQFALLRHGEIVGFFPSEESALQAGMAEAWDDDLYSVQEVTDRKVDLGIFSRVFDFRSN